jgi:two-component system, OmpR family, alkaline phosphatase synthesis response regulator PhoP
MYNSIDMAEETQNKIIIVDDDDFLVNMYATKFGLSGISVEAFKSGEPLLEKLRTGMKADLILLDIVLPEMDGIEILKNIRENKLAEGIPVIMLTNQNDEKNISEAKKLGIASYIVKASATPSEVVAEVMRVIKKS